MFVLFETSAGYALFKVLDESKLEEVENIYQEFQSVDAAKKVVKLKDFHKFEDTQVALEDCTKILEGGVPKSLKKFLKNNIINKDIQDQLAVTDKTVGKAISDKLGIEILYSKATKELVRGIRAHITSLVKGLSDTDLRNMNLGLAHSMSRYKIAFSVDKIDTMIIQAIGLLDDLDKEINNYSMRLKEWYGWHFPELAKHVTDNVVYAKLVQAIGIKTKVATMDLAEICPEEIEQTVKNEAEISMGTEMSEEDELYLKSLASQILSMCEYRASLSDYLTQRMNAIAPNLTIMVGELVGARLIAHAGSLIKLAKYPASTIQVLGAEKALFRAIKKNQRTPKYGLIYHASLVGQSNGNIKGKISRALAAKCALSVRVDALGESPDASVGLQAKTYIETRMRNLESGKFAKVSGSGKQNQQKYTPGNNSGFQKGSYNQSNDVQMDDDSTAKSGGMTFVKAKTSAGADLSAAKGDDDSSSSDDEVVPIAKKSKKIKKEKKEKKEKKKKEKKEKKDKKDKKKKKSMEIDSDSSSD